MSTVHPRVCGEQVVVTIDRCRMRFIPACAGNSCRPCRLRHDDAVHPRVCGEQDSDTRLQSICAVHPRVCGEQRSRCAVDASTRFIPACAGNSERMRTMPLHGRFIPACAGNSIAARDGIAATRFIPACAGNSTARLLRALRTRFIPACAGNMPVSDVCSRRGSSPRVRGTVHRPRSCRDQRFIPACAGNWRDSSGQRPVHPRVCGEQRRAIRSLIRDSAVHPRVCGEQEHGTRIAEHLARFIPACAGNRFNTCYELFICYGSSPRVRGTVIASGSISRSSTGSSPRVRGTDFLYFFEITMVSKGSKIHQLFTRQKGLS